MKFLTIFLLVTSLQANAGYGGPPSNYKNTTGSFSRLVGVTGTVTDETDNPIQAVTINVKGSKNGTTTDAAGKFSIEVPTAGTLIFSSVGYVAQEISVNAETVINVKLLKETQSLNTVVVTALGIKKRCQSLNIRCYTGRWRRSYQSKRNKSW